MSDSVQPHRRQPTRLPRPWDSPGKNTGVGCHFLLQCMKVESESEVAQSYEIPSDPTDCSLPGSSVHGIFQARVLESTKAKIMQIILDIAVFLTSHIQSITKSAEYLLNPPDPSHVFIGLLPHPPD